MRRFKVIADYPHSPYKVGDLVEISESEKSFHCTTTKGYDSFREDIVDSHNYFSLQQIENYEHLFEEIDWWQDLKEDDLKNLPEYIMIDPLIEIEPPFVVFKIIKWELENGELVATTYKKQKLGVGSLKLYLPSNKIEFAKYIREWNKYTQKDE